MKVSIVTVVKNGAETIEETVRSVVGQTYKNVEYLIIDGGSSDRTVEIIKRYEDRVAYWISEPDKGIYDAMNKGIKASTGEVLGILNADDIYADASGIETVVATMAENNTESCYADLAYVDRENVHKIVRYWKGGQFYKERFKRGWMPPHPTFFVKRSLYQKYGAFNTKFAIAADYELMLRFLYRYSISTTYIPKLLIKMRTKGKSHPGFVNTSKAIRENYKAWKINGLRPNPMILALKPVSKVWQYIQRNRIG